MRFSRRFLRSRRRERIRTETFSRGLNTCQRRGHEWRHEPTDTHACMHAHVVRGRARMTERNVMCVSAMRIWKCIRRRESRATKPRSISVRLRRSDERLSHQVSSPLEMLHNDALYLRVICVQRAVWRARILIRDRGVSIPERIILLRSRIASYDRLRHVGNDEKCRCWCGSMKTPGINRHELTAHARGNIETYLLHDVRSTSGIAEWSITRIEHEIRLYVVENPLGHQ